MAGRPPIIYIYMYIYNRQPSIFLSLLEGVKLCGNHAIKIRVKTMWTCPASTMVPRSSPVTMEAKPKQVRSVSRTAVLRPLTVFPFPEIEINSSEAMHVYVDLSA